MKKMILGLFLTVGVSGFALAGEVSNVNGTTTTTTTTKIDCDNWYQDKCYTISSVGPVTSKLEVFDGNVVVFTKIGTINNYTTIGNSGVIVWK